MLAALKHRYTQKITIFRWQLHGLIFFGILLGIGFTLGFLTNSYMLPKIFAATSPWTQTDWSGGSAAGTVTGTVSTYASLSNVDATGTAGQLALSKVEEFSTTGVDSTSELDNWLGINPTSVSGLVFFSKADAGVYTDAGSTAATTGQDVQQWNDQSNNSHHAAAPSAGRRPTLNTNQINGRPALTFTQASDTAGNDDALNAALSSIATLSNSTFFAVGSFDYTNQPVNNYDYLFSVYNSSSPSTTAVGSIARQASNGAQPDNYYTYYNAGALYGPDITTGFKLFTQQFNNTAPRHYLWLNRAAQSVEAAGSLSSISNPTLTLGKWQNGTWAFNGRIAEFLLFNSSLSSGDRQAVENYLNNKYNLGTTTLTVDAITKRTGAGSAKVVTVTNTAELLQTVNVGDTNTYNLVAYAYTDGSEVTSADAELYSHGSTVSTSYTSVGSGWYRLSGTVTGADASRTYGVQVKANKTVYVDDFSLSTYSSSGTITSNILDSEQLSAWGTLSFTVSGSTGTVKVRTSNSSTMSGATDFSSCDAINSGADISTNNCVTDGHRYMQYQVLLATADVSTSPTVSDISIGFGAYDNTAPDTNASGITMATASSGGRSIEEEGWNNATGPYFSWTAGADVGGGAGLLGYCLYLGTDTGGNPASSKGILGTTPVAIPAGSSCQFIVSSTSVDLSTSGYLGSALASGTTYYLNIKAVDNAGNIFGGSSAQFEFVHDVTVPTNVTAICTPGGSFSNVADMSFSWTTTSCATAASDSHAGVLGYQYQINSTAGEWLGTSTDATCGIDYIPAGTFTRTLSADQDGGSIVAGANTVYFRTVDTACNTSSDATIRTGSLNYGGAAPTFGGSDTVTTTPSSSTSNSFGFSWPEATPAGGRTITHYYYMINTSPPSSLSTITSNTATYVDNETSLTVSSAAVSGAVKGSNTIYVVAVDDQDNYSPSNVITGTFTLNSTVPDPPTNLSASDASVKAADLWRASLAWGAPDYKGTGSLTYKIQRGTDGTTWADVTTTSGTAYVDTVTTSQPYYWRVCSYDTSAESIAAPSCASGVTLTPKGTYTDAASLSSGPTVSGVTTKTAKITWGTSRTSDSKISYGTKSGDYFTEEPSNSTQSTDHVITLTNLSPGMTYYYKAKWTDEDGNTGMSSEKSFTTEAAPSVSGVQATDIGLSSAYITFTITGASKATIQYGTSTAYGGTTTISTSTTESKQSVKIDGLQDGTTYHYRIVMEDSEGSEYRSDDYADLITLPRPQISAVRMQQVRGSAQPTVLVSWTTNTEVSSIVTYYPEGRPSEARDEVNVTLRSGVHQMIVRGLFAQTGYLLQVKGRDKAGNEAVSDLQRFTTATDTRPPQIADLKVEGSISVLVVPTRQGSNAQLVVSWNTDELSTSQVEFGEGTGTTYSQKTQEDSNLTSNHSVIISGLTPSKVYHLRALSQDKAGNTGESIDTVTITPKQEDNALDLVITNLSQVFGFLGGLGR